MGSIVKRGKVFRGIIRRDGRLLTKSHATRAEAKQWIALNEYTITERQKVGGLTLAEVLAKYRTDVVAERSYYKDGSASGAAIFSHLKYLERIVGTTEINKMPVAWWLKFVKDLDVGPSSATRYVSLISSALKKAELVWDVTPDWKSYKAAISSLWDDGKLARSGARTRRLHPGELEKILAHRVHTRYPIEDLIKFQLILGFRIGETVKLKWKDFDEVNRMIWVRNRKHPKKKVGNDFHVPLLGEAFDIVKRQPRKNEFVFPYTSTYASDLWIKMRDRAGVEGLTFHDLRHEALSRLFEAGYGIAEVSMISGHADWKSLKRYVQLSPKNLHKGPIALQQRAA